MSDRRLPPLRLLAVFEAVLRSGSLQRAAAELNVSQPAISQAMKSLEDHVGAPLLDRRSRPAALTEAGRILQRAVSDGLGRIADAIEQVRALQRTAAGSVTVACSVGTATYWLMPRLTGFYARQGDIAVNVMTTAQGAPQMAPGVDLAIRYGLGDWADGRVVKLFDEQVSPVCLPAVQQRLAGMAQPLTGAPLLHVEAGEDSWLGWAAYLQQAGLALPQGPGRRFTNYVQATQAALDGQGILLGWESITGDLIRVGRLARLPLPPVIPREAFYLVIPDRRDPKPAVSLLEDWLRQGGQDV